jgi:hypothetical protein
MMDSDIEDAFLGSPWTPNPDGSYSAQGGAFSMQRQADGKFVFNLDKALNPQSLAFVKAFVAVQDHLAARLAKTPPPTLDEVKSLISLSPTTQPAH